MTTSTQQTVDRPASPPSAGVIGSVPCDFCGEPATHIVVRTELNTRWNGCASCISQRRMNRGCIYLITPNNKLTQQPRRKQ